MGRLCYVCSSGRGVDFMWRWIGISWPKVSELCLICTHVFLFTCDVSQKAFIQKKNSTAGSILLAFLLNLLATQVCIMENVLEIPPQFYFLFKIHILSLLVSWVSFLGRPIQVHRWVFDVTTAQGGVILEQYVPSTRLTCSTRP